jgi:DnaJ homolog subfamily C member 11
MVESESNIQSLSNDKEYYAILNISTDATDDDVRHAYRQLASAYHPDKIQDPTLQPSAAQAFSHIQTAYEVLSDPYKREVYDIYGKKGLAAGMELSTDTMAGKSREEIRKDWESFQNQRAKDILESKINHRGTYIFKSDATALISPYRRDLPRTPELISTYMSSQVHIPIDPTNWGPLSAQQDIAYLGGYVHHQRNSAGGGGVLAGYRRTFPDYSSLELQTQLGLRQLISLTTSVPLSQYSNASLSGSWNPQSGLGVQFTTTRQLSEKWSGEYSWVVGPREASGMGLALSRKSDNMELVFRVEVGAATGVSARIMRRVGEGRTARASAKLTPGGVEVEMGAQQKFSDISTAGLAVAAGYQGIWLKMRYNRGGHIFEFPVLLSTSPRPEIIAAAYTLPPLLLWSSINLVIKPVGRLIQRKRVERVREEQRGVIEAAMRETEVNAAVLANAAGRRMRRESEKRGLVVVLAMYGSRESVEKECRKKLRNNSGDSGALEAPQEGEREEGEREEREEEKEEQHQPLPKQKQKHLPASVIDVTTAVQYLVNESQITFNAGYSKSGQMGFCDPAPGEDKMLVIYYVMRSNDDQVYKVAMMDEEGGVVPVKKGVELERDGEGRLVIDMAQRNGLLLDLLVENPVFDGGAQGGGESGV